MGSCHTGSASLFVLIPLVKMNRTGDYLLSRRYHVGLRASITRWTFGGEVGDAISVRLRFMNRADSNCDLGIGRIGNGEAEPLRYFLSILEFVRAISGIAAGNHDHNTRIDSSRHLIAEGTVATAIPLRIERIAEAHVGAIDLDIATGLIHLAQIFKR